MSMSTTAGSGFSASSTSSPQVKSLLTSNEVLSTWPQVPYKFIDGSFHINKARNALAEFLAERLPGARWFDVDNVCDKTNPLPHMLPSDSDFSRAMEDLGLDNDDHVVVYTTRGCFSAARVWWTLRAYGHSKVSILNGGIEAWKRGGGQVETTSSAASAAARASRPYRASLDKRLVVDWKEVLGVVESGSAQICDARSLGRYLAEAPEPRPGMIGGHIPGSLSVPFTALVQEDDPTAFKTPGEMRDALQNAGVVLGSRIVTTCGSGVTAAVITFAMDSLGKDLASAPIYDGSWSEWGDEKLSKERNVPIVGKK